MTTDIQQSTIDTRVAHPIPNSEVNKDQPGVEKWTHNELCKALNKLDNIIQSPIRALESLVYGWRPVRVSELNEYGKQMYTILNAEWDRRIEYWNSQKRAQELEANNSEVAFREEIIEALMEEGKARHVAANLTNTEAKMLAEGKRLGII